MSGSNRRTALLVGYGLAGFLVLFIFSLIFRVAGFFSFWDDGSSNADYFSYAPQQQEVFESLRLESFSGDVYVMTGDSWGLEGKNLPREPRVDIVNNTLVIDGGNHKGNFSFWGITRRHSPTLWLTVPRDISLEDVEISTGAGDVDIDTLRCSRFTLEVGAGDTSISQLIATKSATISGGVGDVDIESGSLRNLSLAGGVGDFDCTAELLGDCSFESGVGDTSLVVLGRQEDYLIKCTPGVGDLEIDGDSVKKGSYGPQNAPNTLTLTAGVGDLDVEFHR